MEDALWCCEPCQRIGSQEKADEHTAETGHACVMLTELEASAVRKMWQLDGRDKWGRWPAVDLTALAALARR
jgi:hypothetical protein